MDFDESNSYQRELQNREKRKRAVMMSIVICGVFMVLLFILIMVITYKDSITEKFYINGQLTSKISDNIYGELNGTTYVDIRALSSVLGYTYTKGEYKKYNENEDSCYLQNNFEIVALSSGKNSYDKYIEIADKATLADIKVTSKNKNGYQETIQIEDPIIFENGKIYVPLTSLPKMLNVGVDWQKYRKKFYTLENQIKKAQTAITKAGYAEMSGYYENLRAITDGFVVVGDADTASTKPTSKYYGVYSLKNGSEAISIKYDEITYSQSVEEFYIKVENGTMGLLDANGGTIIAPSEFEEISLLDKQNQLYLVKKGDEYGIVNRKGKVLVYAENDKIGLDEEYVSEFTLEPINNASLLFDKCIPVEKDGKVGLYNKDGNLILNINFDGLGYKSTSASKTSGNEQSVLLIPSSVGINGIVINRDDTYGIFDVKSEKIILPTSFEKIYAITQKGKTTYYMVDMSGTTYDLKEYLMQQGLNYITEEQEIKETSSDSIEDDEEKETPENEVANKTQDTSSQNEVTNQVKKSTSVENTVMRVETN